MKSYARNVITTSVVALALTGLVAGPAFADNSEVSTIVSGGSLTVAGAGTQLSGATLNGRTAQTVTGGGTTWTLTDARGTGAVWSVSASATDFVSAAGSVDKVARAISVTNFSIVTGAITAAAGSDRAPAATTLIMSNSDQTLVSADVDTKGTYTLIPTFDLTVPVNAYRSNFAGAIENGTPNPYISTVTFTIG